MADRDPYGLADPPNLSTLWGRVLVDELARCGLRHAVIAPGSRSTPLAFACADHPDVSDLSVIDERSAAFVALGLARATGRPAAVISTSGTAAANFLPAVTEADRAGVPLLVLTADRPARLRDAGDSQTADQTKLYGERVRWFHEVTEARLEPGSEEPSLRSLRSTAGHAWSRALGAAGPPGPVHLNLPFEKPLEPAVEGPRPGTPAPEAGLPGALPPTFDPGGVAAGRPGGAPWLEVRSTPPTAGTPHLEATAASVEWLALALAGARRPLILVGAEAGATLPAALGRFLDALPVPVWAEAASGLRTAPESAGRVVGTAELLLSSEGLRRRLQGPDRPDLVLRLGEAPIGWAMRRFAAELAAGGPDPAERSEQVEQIGVDPWGRRRDPEHAVSRIVRADPASLFDALADRLARHPPPAATAPGWSALHRAADRAARRALDREAGAVDELFDGGVFWHLRRLLPEDSALFVSSSMPLREVELFLHDVAETGTPVDLFANRGLNGIDGVTSTALGVALGRRVRRTAGPGDGPGDRPGNGPRAGGGAGGSRTVLVTGDVAFAHDLSGALAAGRLARPDLDVGSGPESGRAPGPGSDPGWDLTVVLIDNGGGAIFDHLPAAGREPGFTRHLSTPPGADFEALARGCRLGYEAPASWDAFGRSLARALAEPGPAVVRVATGRERSRALRERIIDRVAREVDRAIGQSVDDLPELAMPGAGPSSRSRAEAPANRPAAPGAPVVLLHGFTGSRTEWDDLGPRLVPDLGPGLDPGLDRPPVLAVDLPGHGSAPVPAGGATIDRAEATVLRALDRRGLDRAHLVGYSMGGRVALALAVHDPERLASLTLIGASPGIADDAARAERRRADDALARAIEEDGLEAFVDRWMALSIFASQERLGHRFLRRARLRRLAGSSRGYAASLRGMGQGAQPSFWDDLPGVRIPTLLIAGGLDEKYTRIAREMAGRMPDARMEIVPGAGHAVHLEAPETVAGLIREHVEKVERRG